METLLGLKSESAPADEAPQGPPDTVLKKINDARRQE
jgi:hypothetical protein